MSLVVKMSLQKYAKSLNYIQMYEFYSRQTHAFFSLPLSFAATFVCCQMQAVGLQSLVAQDKVRSTDTLGNGGIAPDKCVYHPIAPKGQKHAVFNRKKNGLDWWFSCGR